jgi:hypothetical protein
MKRNFLIQHIIHSLLFFFKATSIVKYLVLERFVFWYKLSFFSHFFVVSISVILKKKRKILFCKLNPRAETIGILDLGRRLTTNNVLN